MGFATPSIIVRDLNAYHRMGLRSISCLTFGAFSALAYPVNLETFARATRSLDIDSDAAVDEIAAARYPGCGAAMARAYRAIARASAMALTYGAVMRPPPEPAGAPRRRSRLLEAAAAMREGVAAAEAIIEGGAGESRRGGDAAGGWRGARFMGIQRRGSGRRRAMARRRGRSRARSARATGAQAIEKVDRAVRHVREIDLRAERHLGRLRFGALARDLARRAEAPARRVKIAHRSTSHWRLCVIDGERQ